MAALSKCVHPDDDERLDLLRDRATVEKAPPVTVSVAELEAWFFPIKEGLSEVLHHHLCPQQVREEILKSISAPIAKFTNYRELVSYTKYMLNFPMAKFLKNPEPECDFKSLLVFSGCSRRWIRNRLNAYNKRNIHLWYSWLNVKRCSDPLPAIQYMADVFIDHKNALCDREDVGDRVTIKRIISNSFFNQLLEEVAEQLPKEYEKCYNQEYAPSTSSCFEASANPKNFKTGGGALGYIRREIGIETPYLGFKQIDKMSFKPRSYVNGKLKKNVVHERSSYYLSDFKQIIEDKCFDDIWTRDITPCIVSAVFEPLKARMISRGPAFQYYCAKPLQKAMWNILMKYPCFKLIGKECCPLDLFPLNEKEGKWFSVDYKASTDNLSWKYSSAIIEKITKYCNLTEAGKDIPALFDAVLGPHEMKYLVVREDDFDKKTDRLGGNMKYIVNGHERIEPMFAMNGVQSTGQLMGSVLSFPILCLANLGVYLDTVCFHGDDLNYDPLSTVLVNGDDMLYKATDLEYYAHEDTGKKVGLQLSEGKVYYHDRYCNINSTCFDFNDRPVEIPFYNVGLLMGQHKVQSKNKSKSTAKSHHDQVNFKETEGPDEWKVRSACNLNMVLKGLFHKGDSERVCQKFISLNRDELYSDCQAYTFIENKRKKFQRNLFLPIFLGGLGVKPPKYFKFKITNLQQIVASNLLMKFNWHPRPLPGPELVEEQPECCKFIHSVKFPERPLFRLHSSHRFRKSYLRNILPSYKVGQRSTYWEELCRCWENRKTTDALSASGFVC